MSTTATDPEASEGGAEKPSGKKARASNEIAGKSPTRIAMARLRRDKVAVVCIAIVALLVLAAVFASVINDMLKISGRQGEPYSVDPAEGLNGVGFPLSGPPYFAFDSKHPLGLAPGTAVDNLARLLLGLRISLSVAFIATFIGTMVGVVMGLFAGYARGWLDTFLSFVIDLFLSFPFILGALAVTPIIVSQFGDSEGSLAKAQFLALIGVLVTFGWMGLARLVRGQVMSLREREFVQAAQVLGAPTGRILFRELLPNLVAPIVVSISLALPGFVAAEAGLSFLGIGLTGSLGQTISSATAYYATYPLYLWAPVITVTVLVVALNLLGDAVRDAFDPKTRR